MGYESVGGRGAIGRFLLGVVLLVCLQFVCSFLFCVYVKLAPRGAIYIFVLLASERKMLRDIEEVRREI